MCESSKCVLLVEQGRTLAEFTAFRLQLLQYDVIVLASARQALDWLNDELPDLAIVGHVLPDMSGLELLDQIRSSPRTESLPTILLSHQVAPEDVQRAFDAGADDYLMAPFDPQTLERKVKRLAPLAVR